MPSKSFRKCGMLGCFTLSKDNYCDVHKKEHRKHNDRWYNLHREDDKEVRFYKSKEWKRLRLQVLQRDNYLCQHCLIDGKLIPANVVDHVIPVKEDWNLTLEINNLQVLCASCHNKKTNDDKKKYSKG